MRNKIVWDSYYNIDCSNNDPNCIEILPKQRTCKCQIIYSIPKTSIDLQYLRDIYTKYENDKVIITPQTLLDYEYISQHIFSNPDQTDNFGRKLAIYVNNIFVKGRKFTQAFVESKLSEWTKMGQVILVQHYIHLF